MLLTEKNYLNFLNETVPCDSAHDLAHIKRVVKNATSLQRTEGGSLDIIAPAAWLHDCVSVPKDSPDREQASRLAAKQAAIFLKDSGFTDDRIEKIAHAIEAHSFSAAIAAQTLEAKIVQDADRLDSLGAIGIARCFLTGGKLDRPLYAETDAFCDSREPDDSVYSIDHFYKKLLKLAQSMQTETGKKIAEARASYMNLYLEQLRREVELGEELR